MAFSRKTWVPGDTWNLVAVNDLEGRVETGIAGAGGGGSTDAEIVRDTIATALVAGANVTITHDGADTITIAAADTNTSAIPLLSPVMRSGAVEVKNTRWPSGVRYGSLDEPEVLCDTWKVSDPSGGVIAADAGTDAAGATEVNPAASSAATPATATKRSRSGAGK